MLQSKAYLAAHVAASALTLSVPCNANAQQSAAPPSGESAAQRDNSSGIGEIVVTAQKRNQNAQDVPITITVLSGEQLQARGIAAIENLDKASPGVLITEYGGTPSGTAVSIRGVVQLDYTDHQESPNALYIDGAYIGFPATTGTAMYDVDNLEILRGPQGTLFGRNATGGLIQVTTRRPTDILDGYAQVSYGSYNRVNVEGAISDKIAGNLSGRLSVQYNRQDGYLKNDMGPNAGNDNTLNVRGQLQYEFDSGTKDVLEASFSRTFPVNAGGYIPYPIAPNPANHNLSEPNSGGLFVANCAALGYTVSPGATNCLGYVRNNNSNAWAISDPYTGYFARSVYGLTNTFTKNLGFATLTSVSNFATYNRKYLEDDSDNPVAIFGSAYGIGPGNRTIARQWSEELRLNGHSPRLDWVLGAYALWIQGDYSLLFPYGNIADPYLTTGVRYHQNVRTFAIFGQADYKLTDKLLLVAGLRGNNDYKSMNLVGLCDSDPATCALYGSGPNGAGFYGDNHHNDWSARLQLTYEFNRNAMIYAGVNRGNKAGAVPVPPGAPFPGTTFASQFVKPEELLAYETGFKTSWLGDHLRLNGDVFYYDYNNIQAFKTEGLAAVLFNAKAREYGAEMEATVRPARYTTISGNMALLHTKVEGVTLPDGTIADQQQAFAPHASWNANLRQELPTEIGKFFIQAAANHVGSFYFSTVNETATQSPSRTTVDLSGGWISEDARTTLTVSVTNLTNKAYPVYAYDLSSTAGYGEENLAPPRWVNVKIARKFR